MIKKLVLAAIKAFQATRVFRAPACRFYPSCSTYAAQAVDRHGVLSATFLSAWRVLRCHPLHPGGVDPVPDTVSFPLRSGVGAPNPTKI